MKNYTQLIEKINTTVGSSSKTHITHFEDVVFYDGFQGVKDSLTTALKLAKQGNVIVSEKYDGAPSIFFGPAPKSKRFFIATKGIFNQKPKLFFSEKEIKENNKPALAKKLIYAFRYLKTLKPKCILQGDLLFVKGDVNSKTIQGEGFLTFQPNIIVYALPTESSLSDNLIKAKIGISIHTKWKGSTIEKLKPIYNVENAYSTNENVFVIDPYKIETDFIAKIDGLVSKTYKLAKSLKNELNMLAGNKSLARKIEQHYNNLIKTYSVNISPLNQAISLQQFVGQIGIEENKLERIVDLHRNMIEIKTKLLKTLNKRKAKFKMFVLTNDNEYSEIDGEGFVVITASNKPLKIIDRLEFSTYNFDDENTIRGWQKE